MEPTDRSNIDMYKTRINSLHEVFLGIKMLHACTLPLDSFYIIDRHFQFLNIETATLIIGKLYILLADNYKGKNNYHNTISFKILLDSMLRDSSFSLPCKKEIMKSLLHKIDEIDKKYRTFRDKTYAHIDLNKNNQLLQLNHLKVSPKDITNLLEVAENTYDVLFCLLMEGASSDHMRGDIEKLSTKLWEAYGKVGLVKK